MTKRITDAMIDAELARQDRNRDSGVVEVVGRVDANLSFSQVVVAVVVANLITAVILGIVAGIVTLAVIAWTS